MDNKEFEEEFKDIPPMPHIMIKALEVIKNPRTSVRELANIMAVDQAISAKTLSLVNSAFYGFRQQITSINKAVVILGMMKAKNIIMSLALKSMMSSHGSRELWDHSVKCGVAAEILAQQHRVINPDDAFVIGFLHDIGKMVLTARDPVKYSKVKYIAQQNKEKSIIELEKAFFGTNHCILGANLSKKWNLPVILTNCIKYHHTPELSSLPAACGIIYFADRLIQTKMPDVVADDDILDRLNLRISDPRALREEVLAKSAIFLKELSAHI